MLVVENPILQLFADLRISIGEKDSFELRNDKKFLIAKITHENGIIELVRKDLATDQFFHTTYNKVSSKNERDRAIKKLKQYGYTQSLIAEMLGITQSTVSTVLRK